MRCFYRKFSGKSLFIFQQVPEGGSAERRDVAPKQGSHAQEKTPDSLQKKGAAIVDKALSLCKNDICEADVQVPSNVELETKGMDETHEILHSVEQDSDATIALKICLSEYAEMHGIHDFKGMDRVDYSSFSAMIGAGVPTTTAGQHWFWNDILTIAQGMADRSEKKSSYKKLQTIIVNSRKDHN